jgi:hypothetical protein
MQNDSDGRGGTRSRLSDDIPAVQLATELNRELQGNIPYGCSVTLELRTPILNKRATKHKLKDKLLAAALCNNAQILKTNILGNVITIKIGKYDGPGHICGCMSSIALPRYDNLSTIRYILEERIATKTRKCRSLPFEGILWLALLDCYLLADAETWHQAMGMIANDHPFQKILLVSRNRYVTVLFENNH